MLGAFALTGTAAAEPSNCSPSGSTITCTFSYTGAAQSFIVPAGVQSITVTAGGAAGGESGGADFAHAAGGLGGQVQGTLTVTPGEMLQVNVGGQGGTDGNQADGLTAAALRAAPATPPPLPVGAAGPPISGTAPAR